MTKRQRNNVNTQTFEQLIISYEAKEMHEAADAIRDLAQMVGAPIDEQKIAEGVKIRSNLMQN